MFKKTTLVTTLLIGLCLTFVGCGGGGGGGDEGDPSTTERLISVDGDWDLTIDFGHDYTFDYDVEFDQNGTKLSGSWIKGTSIALITGSIDGTAISFKFVTDTGLKLKTESDFTGTVTIDGDYMSGTVIINATGYKATWEATRK